MPTLQSHTNFMGIHASSRCVMLVGKLPFASSVHALACSYVSLPCLSVTSEGLHAVLQAMDLIAIAQQTGDVSPEAYQRLALRGNLQPPQMLGVEELMQRLAMAEAAANPFANGGGAAPEASPSGGGGGHAQFRPPAVIPPSMASPARSQVRRTSLSNLR